MIAHFRRFYGSHFSLFNQSSKSKSTGLFNLRAFRKLDEFSRLSNEVVQTCQKLEAKVYEQISRNDGIGAVDTVDQMSNTLCSLLDACECLRNLHPQVEVIDAADEAVCTVSTYMNKLNRNGKLYNALKLLSEKTDNLDDETRGVVEIFLKDFETSGINSTEKDIQKFISLNSLIDKYGYLFQRSSTQNKQKILEIESNISSIKGLPNDLIQLVLRVQKDNRLPANQVPNSPYLVNQLLCNARDSQVRKEIYVGSKSNSWQSLEYLEGLLDARFRLAKLVGYPSYSHLAIQDKMCKSPENVKKILIEMYKDNSPLAQSEYKLLSELKQRYENSTQLFEWDVIHYMNVHQSFHPVPGANISVGKCFEYLGRFLETVFAIKLIPGECEQGEIWHSTVRKLLLYRGDEFMGTIYLDLFKRPNKVEECAHFTIQCRRKNRQITIESPICESKSHSVQFPIVVLSFPFQSNLNISIDQVESIFHEFGHALHTLLATNTRYHNTSGTRCQTDFVEIPSMLMENFAKDIRIVPRPDGSCENHFKHLARQTQIVSSLVDLEYHGNWDNLKEKYSSSNHMTTKIYQEIQENYSTIPPTCGICPESNFRHLFSYGSTYYSYLICEKVSQLIWKRFFKDNPLDNTEGQRYLDSVLSWGGSKDGMTILTRYFGENPLK